MNNGAGTFGAIAEYPVGGPGQDITAADLNGDGRLDLVVTINDPQIGLSLLTGNGDGIFGAPVAFPNTSGFDSPAVAAVDLDNDGKLDVVVAHEIACYTAPCVASEVISVMIGNGDGTFQSSREIQVGRGMTEIAVGDYNRDGFKDLALAGIQGQVYRLYGVGDGTFVQQPTLTAVADTFFIPVTDIDVADFNGDSIQDLVVAVPHNGSRTAILIGNADGTFRAPLVLTDPGLNIPQQQAVADYNGDGFQDLALSLGDGGQGVMQIRNGNGDGTFQAPVQYLVPPPTSSLGGIFIVAAHLNGDTKPDIGLNIGGAFPASLSCSTRREPLRHRRREHPRSSARHRTRRPRSRWPSTGRTSPGRRHIASRSTTRTTSPLRSSSIGSSPSRSSPLQRSTRGGATGGAYVPSTRPAPQVPGPRFGASPRGPSPKPLRSPGSRSTR